MQLPSKELLSEVLNEEYNERLVDWYEIKDNYLCTYYDCGKKDVQGRPTGLGIEINIYELQHLMKEWITKTALPNCILSTFNSTSINGYGAVINDEKQFLGHTEFEAVVKACEWVLENKDKQ